MKLLLRRKWLAGAAVALTATAVGTLAVLAAPVDMGVGNPGTLTLQGSTTVGPIVDMATTDYQTENPGHVLVKRTPLAWTGSDDGKRGAILHYSDMGVSSSTLKTDAGSGDPSTVGGAAWSFPRAGLKSEADVLNAFPVSRDGLVFIVNDSVTGITAITKDQLLKIYNGTYTDWGQIVDVNNPATHGPAGIPIVPRMRDLPSGTRASWKDSVGLTFANPDVDPAYNPAYVPGTATTENVVRVQTNLPRLTGNVDVQGAINTVGATGQCGYVGLGFENGAHIRIISLYDTNAAGAVAWAPTAMNIYAKNPANSKPYYPFARFIFMVTPKYTDTTFTTPVTSPIADIGLFSDWMRATDGSGQQAVVDTGFLKLVPDVLVVTTESGSPKWSINSADLGMVSAYVGRDVGTIPVEAKRALCVRTENGNPKSVVNSADLGLVSAWVGLNLVPN